MANQGGATLGFIGLGTMGTPIAGHLVRAGHAVRGASVPATEAARGVYAEALTGGLGEKVFTATLCTLERRAGVEVAPLARKEKGA